MTLLWVSVLLSFFSIVWAYEQPPQSVPNDPFYDVPPNLDQYKPGDIIRRREISQKFWVDANISKIVEVAYKTNLALGGDTWSIATIITPGNPDPNLKLYSYQFFEDAVQLSCAPSWSLKNGLFSPGISSVVNSLTGTVGSQLRAGRHVVVPDHEGYISAFFSGRQEGKAGLDGIRAALNELNASVSDTPVALYGYSGGGHATAWMVNLQPDYAPELNIVGAAYGGVLIDALKELQWTDQKGAEAKGSVAALLTGLLLGNPPANESLWSHFSPYLKTKIYQLRTIPNFCSSELLWLDSDDTIQSNIDVDIATFPPAVQMFKKETLLSNYSSIPIPTPKFPRYIYQGVDDTLAPYYLVKQYVDQQLATGANIEFVPYPGLDHIPVAFKGLDAAMDWIDQVFDKTD